MVHKVQLAQLAIGTSSETSNAVSAPVTPSYFCLPTRDGNQCLKSRERKLIDSMIQS